VRSFVGTAVKLAVAACLTWAAALGAGFLWFAAEVANAEPDHVPDVDGIVALTGGAQRLPDAARLLSEGRGRRLLISGVNAGTTRADVTRMLGVGARFADCCIDLDYAALNTVGNAEETRKWARSHGFRSLIVVTSAWHMPRSLAELRHVMPDVHFVPYPVVRRETQEEWWESAESVQLLATEYAKYLVALARRTVAPAPADQRRLAPVDQPRPAVSATYR
jgi:uncharacterized SAM-binding protein YcdF (DUF218 family)